MLYTILLSTLGVQGYAAVEGDGFVKIVPEAEAKTSSSPTGEAALKVPGDRIVTQVFILQNENGYAIIASGDRCTRLRGRVVWMP